METKKIIVDFEKTASFDIDPQCGFTPLCPRELPVSGGDLIVKACLENHKLAKYKYVSKDAHPINGLWNATSDSPQLTRVENAPNVDLRWNQHCVVGTPGFELLLGLPHISEYDFIVYKGAEKDMHPYSPIYQDLAKKISTGVIEKAKNDGVDTFILGGLALDYCVGQAAFDLVDAGFRVIINLEATAAIGNPQSFIDNAHEVSENIIFVKNVSEITSN